MVIESSLDLVDRPRRLDRLQSPRIQSVARVAGILDVLATAPPPGLELRAIASRVHLAKTTTFTLVQSLCVVGLVEQDSLGGHYRLGLQNLVYGRAVERSLDVVTLARPTMLRLAEATRETVNLAVPRPFEAFIVDSLEGSRSVRVTSYAGTPAAYHSTACGRALLAHLPEHAVAAIVGARPLAAPTPRTITKPAELHEALIACRASGIAVEREENEPDAACVAAPILAPHGEAIAAISIAAPSQRMTEPAVERFAALLRAETKAISIGLRGTRRSGGVATDMRRSS